MSVITVEEEKNLTSDKSLEFWNYIKILFLYK